jgi:hypothetical protein
MKRVVLNIVDNCCMMGEDSRCLDMIMTARDRPQVPAKVNSAQNLDVESLP